MWGLQRPVWGRDASFFRSHRVPCKLPELAATPGGGPECCVSQESQQQRLLHRRGLQPAGNQLHCSTTHSVKAFPLSVWGCLCFPACPLTPVLCHWTPPRTTRLHLLYSPFFTPPPGETRIRCPWVGNNTPTAPHQAETTPHPPERAQLRQHLRWQTSETSATISVSFPTVPCLSLNEQ